MIKNNNDTKYDSKSYSIFDDIIERPKSNYEPLFLGDPFSRDPKDVEYFERMIKKMQIELEQSGGIIFKESKRKI